MPCNRAKNCRPMSKLTQCLYRFVQEMAKNCQILISVAKISHFLTRVWSNFVFASQVDTDLSH